MIRLKEILFEFFDKDVTALRDYINSTPDERVNDVVTAIGESSIIQWFIENDGTSYDILYDYREYEDEIMGYESLNQLEEDHFELYEELINLLKAMTTGSRVTGVPTLEDLYSDFGHSYADIPTWKYLEKPMIVKNQWLIHATGEDDVYSIFKDGFIRGVDDYSKLGLTTWYDGRSFEKKGGGYNFAYTIKDFRIYGKTGDGTKYGDGGTFVLFRASGIRCWHRTDGEYQVIFNGKTARDIVPVFLHNGKWVVYSKEKKPLVRTDTTENVIDWIKQNYSQYRKSIGWQKPIG